MAQGDGHEVEMERQAGHVPVLVGQVLELLRPRAGGVVLDCTLGRGGHAAAILPLLGPGGRYVGLDVDGENLDFARARLIGPAAAEEVGLNLVRANFAEADRVLADLGLAPPGGGVDGLLADLGFSSNQMDRGQRGFSFDQDGPLDMRLDDRQSLDAATLVNRLPERELADLIYQGGEEPLSRRIAAKIVAARRQAPIKTTRALAALVHEAYGGRARFSRVDPATRTFMALRIAVNGELDALQALLAGLPRLMKPAGRVAIISFHSLEDRLVKRAFVGYQQAGLASRLTRKPWMAEDHEVLSNPRSRSAKLRGLAWGYGDTDSADVSADD